MGKYPSPITDIVPFLSFSSSLGAGGRNSCRGHVPGVLLLGYQFGAFHKSDELL